MKRGHDKIVHDLARAKKANPDVFTNWMTEEPCPRCDGMTMATNGRSRWCVRRECGWTRIESNKPGG